MKPPPIAASRTPEVTDRTARRAHCAADQQESPRRGWRAQPTRRERRTTRRSCRTRGCTAADHGYPVRRQTRITGPAVATSPPVISSTTQHSGPCTLEEDIMIGTIIGLIVIGLIAGF